MGAYQRYPRHPLEESYQARVIENFRWEDWIDPAKTLAQPHMRTDTRLKNYPYHDRPVAVPAQWPGSG